ncbi:PEP-CTERM sorting domain-containing protein [Telmatospirillum sp.]|uniref:PEP-CTERM sorting domain-containing protein n=1 Tax=Telmatospirillum sp. TaxID=2079197 RepID=UPI00284A5C9E|nr:PEP-CTERM sorting domain-containing protein [Telmatospirillum sp.]MDR3437296.1 PEP-CTERM sorting domain-containing protein [Telmatospirillum sp.]
MVATQFRLVFRLKLVGFFAGFLALATMLAAPPARAAVMDYRLNFTDSTSHSTGTGSFLWNTDTQTMTDLTWNFSGMIGSITDSRLASTYYSWDPLASTYGVLFYNYLTAPQAYLIAEYGLLSSASGVMPEDVTGDFGFVAFGAESTSSDATYRFLDRSWAVVTEGTVSAHSVPEPNPMALLLFGLGLVAATSWRRASVR